MEAPSSTRASIDFELLQPTSSTSNFFNLEPDSNTTQRLRPRTHDSTSQHNTTTLATDTPIQRSLNTDQLPPRNPNPQPTHHLLTTPPHHLQPDPNQPVAMSIPGLGQFTPAPQPTPSTTRQIPLRPLAEYRFEVPRSNTTPPLTIRLTSGTAQRDGTELAQNRVYSFPRGTRARLVSYTGGMLEVTGEVVAERVVGYERAEESPEVGVLNLHFALEELRAAGRRRENGGFVGNRGGRGVVPGPRVMVCGEAGCGKTSVVRTLAALATRGGGQPIVGNVDPREGMLALPGTVSAAVFGTVMDVEDPAGGVGVSGTPSSGPSAVPVKLPMVYYFGRERVAEDVGLWRDLVGKLGSSVRAKFAADEVVREAGLVLDTPAATIAKGDVDVLVHAVNEFAGGFWRQDWIVIVG